MMQGDEAALIAGAVAGWSYAEIAAAAGVSISTVQRRLRDPEVLAAVQEGRRQQRRQAVGRVNERVPLAMQRLGELLLDEDPQIALKAIALLVGSASRLAAALEVEERLATLEAMFGGESL
jgi:AcrR family transcriptional regulator